MTIPAAVEEMTEREALDIAVDGDQHGIMRCIYRDPNGGWALSLEERTPNRDEAHIWENYRDTPLQMREDMIVEFLPDDDAPAAARVPPATRELDGPSVYRIWGTNREDPRITGRVVVRVPSGWVTDRGVVTNRENATIYPSFGQATRGTNTDSIIEFLDGFATGALLPRLAPDGTPAKVSLVKTKFLSEFISMFEKAPKNEFVRGWILKVARQMPPEDIDTIDKLEAWLQSITPKGVSATAPAQPVDGLKIPLAFSGKDSGQCSYSVRTIGTAEFEFDEGDLNESVEEYSSEGFSSVLDAVKETLAEQAFEQTDASMEPVVSTYSYTDHEADDGGRDGFDYNHSILESRLKDWIRYNMPDKAAEMGI